MLLHNLVALGTASGLHHTQKSPLPSFTRSREFQESLKLMIKAAKLSVQRMVSSKLIVLFQAWSCLFANLKFIPSSDHIYNDPTWWIFPQIPDRVTFPVTVLMAEY